MKKVFLITLISLLFSASSFAKHNAIDTSKHDSLFVRDGSSFEKAIYITETTEQAGGRAEYKWLAVHYPGYMMGSQALVYHDKRPFDILYIKTEAGLSREVYFDISNYFGKW